MSYLIVSDSSSNIFDIPGENYKTVPMHIIIDGKEWDDTPELDIREFNRVLEASTGVTSSSCPSPDEWVNAFGDAEEIYCITISKNLSGSYCSAVAAKHVYEERHPGRKVYVVDSLATGPAMILMMDFMRELLAAGFHGEEIVKRLDQYRLKQSVLMFTLQSVKRLAANGRVNPLLVKAIGVLDLRMIGYASDEGRVSLVGKNRGAANVLKGTFKSMLKFGYSGGKVVISHNQNESDANALAGMIREKFGNGTSIRIHQTSALCSYYAEKYGYIVGFDINEHLRHHFFL